MNRSLFKIILVFMLFISYEGTGNEEDYINCLESRKKEITSSMEAGVIIWECKYDKKQTKEIIIPKNNSLKTVPKEADEGLINL